MTLVSHRHRFIFLKTRKTGGTSVEMLLEPMCRLPGQSVVHHTTGSVTAFGIVGVRVSPGRFSGLRAEGRMPTTTYSDAAGHRHSLEWGSHTPAARVKAALPADVWDGYLRLIAVRNPFTRAVSYYFHEAFIGNLPWPRSLSEAQESFRSFVRSDSYRNDYDITHVNGRRAYHHAFRLEYRSDDLPRLGRLIGVPLDAGRLPHMKNLTAERATLSNRDLYDRASAEAVRQASAWVFDAFEYSTDLDDARLDPPPRPAQSSAVSDVSDEYCLPDCPDCAANRTRRQATRAPGLSA